MKILSADQIRQLDAQTIENRGIDSIELMEHASGVFFAWLIEKSDPTKKDWLVFAGSGNNGGDALAVARMLAIAGYNVHAYLCEIGELSTDCQINHRRLNDIANPHLRIDRIRSGDAMPNVKSGSRIVDGIFGSGINRPVIGYWGELIEHLNHSGSEIYSVDIPSGMQMDMESNDSIINAISTLSFELPKLAFMIPENANYTGKWDTRSIGLDQNVIETMVTHHYFLDAQMLTRKILLRKKFDHKGTYGHALIIAGSQGKMGAAILAAKACLRSGVGKVTAHLPKNALEIMQIAVPEAMVDIDIHDDHFTGISTNHEFDAIGLGPGLGTHETTKAALKDLVGKVERPIIIDADGINIMADDRRILENLPSESILTPHIKEFENLFGKSGSHFERLKVLRQAAIDHKLNIVLKGAHTAIADPRGNIYFNSTGNPGMATAGSGDVLLGIITGLVAQGYTPLDACQFGVYIHGLAGDHASEKIGEEALIAGDLVEHLGRAFLDLHGQSFSD